MSHGRGSVAAILRATRRARVQPELQSGVRAFQVGTRSGRKEKVWLGRGTSSLDSMWISALLVSDRQPRQPGRAAECAAVSICAAESSPGSQPAVVLGVREDRSSRHMNARARVKFGLS